jgi:hypothetical protein
VASCVTGNWRSTAVSAQAATVGANANLSGGGGVAVTIGANGQTTIDFSKMQPVAFTATAAGTQVTGSFTFAGKVAGTVRTGTGGSGTSAGPSTGASPSTSASPATSAGVSASTGAGVPGTSASAGPTMSASAGTGEGTSGTWDPVPPIDWGDTRVTVDLLQPVKVRVLDNAQIRDYAGDGASRTGNVIDVEPFLGKGTYQCTGDTLVLTPDDGGMSWNLTRA